MPLKDETETVEFFTPKLGLAVEPYIEAEQKQGIHHLGRYHWAAAVLEKRQPASVLDVACGAGYGSLLLAQRLPNTAITGCDYDERAIEHARKNYAAPNLRYMVGDMAGWRKANDRPLGKFDAVVSFDTIEHLLHREIALLRVVDNLSPAGMLLLSTPCGHSVTRLNPGWEHHKVEYSYTDLYALLRRFFGVVLWPQHADFPEAAYWSDVINRDKVRYFNKMNPLFCERPIAVEAL